VADVSEIRICCLACGQDDPTHDVPAERLVYDAATAKPGDTIYVMCRECIAESPPAGRNGGYH